MSVLTSTTKSALMSVPNLVKSIEFVSFTFPIAPTSQAVIVTLPRPSGAMLFTVKTPFVGRFLTRVLSMLGFAIFY